MRGTAAAAAMSAPQRNRWFSRRWHEQPSAEPLAPPPMYRQPEDHLEITGRDLLLLWRRERAQHREAAQ